jgi:hypothetical protein
MRASLLLFGALFVPGLVACSSDAEIVHASSGQGGGTTTTSSSTTAEGAGGAGTGGAAQGGAGGEGTGGMIPYPAPHPSMPVMPDHGGAVLHDPVIVTVTYDGDPERDFLETFGDTIGATDWWKAVHDEYGVGPGSSGGHVHLAEAAPTVIKDSEIQQWLAQRIGDATLPAPTDQSIYVLFYPAETTITLDMPGGGDSCQSFGGYHNSTVVNVGGTDIPVAYAVIPRCDNSEPSLTVTTSHELTEASTDPHPIFGQLGYMLTKKTAWNPAGGENADMCEFVSGVQEGPYYVTRAWSNANAKLGDQPCVPVPDDPDGLPYYNAGIKDEIMKAPPGGTVSTNVYCYSFGPLPNPMTLQGQTYGKNKLTFTFDPPTCENGTIVKMTVQVSDAATVGRDYSYQLLAQLNDQSAHLWRGMITVTAN